MSRTLLAFLTLLVSFAATSPLHAQEPKDLRDAEARSLFEAGRTAMIDGRYEDSLDYFERAYTLSERPLMLYNIAVVSDRLRLNQKALNAYERYLQTTAEPDNRVEVERRIEILRQELAREEALAEAAAASEAEAALAVQAAQASQPARPSETREDAQKRWWKSPWLWTAVGVVVIGASVGAGVAASSSGGGIEEPLPSDATFPTPAASLR